MFALVLMPFDAEFQDCIARDGAERVDEQIYQEGILERIYRQIELADISSPI